MRKALDQLDNKQREALLEVVDFGIAMCSAAVAIGLLRGIMDLLIGS